MESTKKFIFTWLTVLLFISFAGCSGDASESSVVNLSLGEIVEELCKGVDVPPYDTVQLDTENFEYFAFVPYEDGISAVAADALVNITPHSVVLIHTENGNGGDLAGKIIKNADPNKWLCVGSEAVRVAYTDHYVVLVMSYEDIADDITENFKKLANELDGVDATVLVATNERYDGLY